MDIGVAIGTWSVGVVLRVAGLAFQHFSHSQKALRDMLHESFTRGADNPSRHAGHKTRLENAPPHKRERENSG